MNDYDSAIKDFLKTTRTMETNIVTVISDSNRDIEVILKELLIYLDATSKNLEKILVFTDDEKTNKNNNSIEIEIRMISDKVKLYHDKLLDLEIENTKRILSLVKQVGLSNNKIMKQIIVMTSKIGKSLQSQDVVLSTTVENMSEIKTLLKIITNEVKDTKDNLKASQSDFVSVIDNLLDSNTRATIAKETVHIQEIKTDEEKFKAKISLAAKIAGLLLGSGSIIYLIIDIILGG